LRPTPALLIAFSLLLLATQSLGAAHRASHRAVDPPSCQLCTFSGSPLAVAAAPLPQPVTLAVGDEIRPPQPAVHETPRSATSPRGPPLPRSPLAA